MFNSFGMTGFQMPGSDPCDTCDPCNQQEVPVKKGKGKLFGLIPIPICLLLCCLLCCCLLCCAIVASGLLAGLLGGLLSRNGDNIGVMVFRNSFRVPIRDNAAGAALIAAVNANAAADASKINALLNTNLGSSEDVNLGIVASGPGEFGAIRAKAYAEAFAAVFAAFGAKNVKQVLVGYELASDPATAATINAQAAADEKVGTMFLVGTVAIIYKTYDNSEKFLKLFDPLYTTATLFSSILKQKTFASLNERFNVYPVPTATLRRCEESDSESGCVTCTRLWSSFGQCLV